MWLEYCDEAAEAGKPAFSYQLFAREFAAEAERTDAVRHFRHEPGQKCFVDWAGDTAWVTDKVTGRKTKVYTIVVCLPFSAKFWAEGFCDMTQRSWQAGHAHAFEDFGGVPRMFVPDNAATATDRSAACVTLVNAEYERFAEHYGAAVVPTRVRKPRDKSLAETTVNIVEQWIIAPANERVFYTLDEFNEFCADKVAELNARPFSAREGSRDSVYDEEERVHMLPLPAERYEMCEWRSAKVSPDYHVAVDYMRYSVPFRLVGERVDVRLTDSRVEVMHDGERVAEHPRLHGRKGQYSTFDEHMPESHRAMESPWSPERFSSWARRIGPECGEAVRRLMASKPVVEQSFVTCRNILGLSKRYSPELLERACARMNELQVVPSYTACKNAVLAIRSADAEARASERGAGLSDMDALVDRAKSAGRVRGADAYRRGGAADAD